jgi:hypothetical protein
MNPRSTVVLSTRMVLVSAVLLFILPGKGLAQGPQIVTCASEDMHRQYCEAGPNNGIRLIRQRSESRCEMGRSYGFRGNQIWVDRGCRADFEVTPRYVGRGRDHDGYPDRNRGRDWDRSGLSSQIVYCSSDNMRRNYCNIGPHGQVRLVRQRSESACELNRTYGIRGDSIWADRGCRAEFEVVSRAGYR